MGFVQRWLILEPIRAAGQLTDSAVRTLVSDRLLPRSTQRDPS